MHSHKGFDEAERYKMERVLILVVMEDALALVLSCFNKVTNENVLILVVMEDALARKNVLLQVKRR